MTEEDGGITAYQYDAAYQLVRVDYPQRPGQQGAGVKNNGTDKGKGKKNGHHKNDENLLPTSVSYGYDAAGNRVSKSDDFQTLTSV